MNIKIVTKEYGVCTGLVNGRYGIHLKRDLEDAFKIGYYLFTLRNRLIVNIKKTPYNRRLKKYEAFLYYRQWWINWGLCESHARVQAYHQAFRCYREVRVNGSNPSLYSGI